MSEIIQKDGVDVEVFTAEELEAQKQEALEQYKAENPDKSEEMQTLQKELEETQNKLKGLESKDLSFSNLRKEKTDLEEKVSVLTKDIDSKIEKAKKEMFEGVMKDHYEDRLKSLASGDEELAKKIKYEFDVTLGAVTATTKSEMDAKFKKAYVLAGGTEERDFLSSDITSSGSASRISLKPQGKISEQEKAIIKQAAAAGGIKLDDKDIK